MELIIDFYNRLVGLNFEVYYLFFLINKFILIFFFITYVLIIFDDRFRLRNKILILILFLLSITFLNMYDYMDLHIFIKELYWYSLILNGSFIFHVCWLHWIYKYFWSQRNNSKYLSKNNVEFLCNKIKVLGFILSLSFLVFLFKWIYSFYLNLVKNSGNFIEVKYIKFLIGIPKIIILTIIAILKFFIFIFISYAKFIIGKDNNIFNFWNIFMFIIYFIFSWIVAYYVLGISRLLFNWLLIFTMKSIELFNKYKFFFREKYPEIKNRKLKLLEYFFFYDFEYIIIAEVLKYQTRYFHQWYDIFYKPGYNYPQYSYLNFNKEHKLVAFSTFNDGVEIFKEVLYKIFIENESWFMLAKSICLQKLKKENISNEEFKKLLKEMELWFNLTAFESNDIFMDYTIVKTAIDIYGYEKVVNLKK